MRRHASHRVFTRKTVRPAGVLLLIVGIVLPLVSDARAEGVDSKERDAALVELGRRLFFDPVISASGERSCASCHDPDHGFSDARQFSPDDFGITARHSQPILDTVRNPSAHWDGEFKDVADLVQTRLSSAPDRLGTGRYQRSRRRSRPRPPRCPRG